MSLESQLADSTGQINRAVEDLAAITRDLDAYIDTKATKLAAKKIAAAEARADKAEAELAALKQHHGIQDTE